MSSINSKRKQIADMLQISKQCLKRQEDDSSPCPADDFDCICKASNSLANNSQFNQQCVFDECKLDTGREGALKFTSLHQRDYSKKPLLT